MLLETLVPMFILLGFATVLQTLSGFGFGLMVVSSFTLFNLLPLTATTFLISVLGLVNSTSIVLKNVHLIHRKAFTLVLIGGIPFIAVGYALLEYLSAGLSVWLNILLGLAILTCCLLLIVKRSQSAASGKGWGFLVSGALGGILGGLFSTFGPPVVFQCYRQSWSLNEVRYTLLAIFSVTALIRLAMVPFGTLPDHTTVVSTLFAIPLILIFTRIGRLLAARVEPSVVRLLAISTLALSGLTLILQNVPHVFN
jgi:uncharacterized membrane protein YfcA